MSPSNYHQKKKERDSIRSNSGINYFKLNQPLSAFYSLPLSSIFSTSPSDPVMVPPFDRLLLLASGLLKLRLKLGNIDVDVAAIS